MEIAIWTAAGSLIGFVAGLVLHASPQRRIAYLLLGMVGALGGGLVARADRDAGDGTALIVAALTAIVLLGIVNLFRRSPAG